jgi:hypothetical protein
MQLVNVPGDAVRHRTFDVVPDEFIGIEFWSIGWQQMDVEAGMGLEKLGNDLRSVWQPTIPEKDQRSTDVTQEMPEEVNNLLSADVLVGMKSTIQSQAPASG